MQQLDLKNADPRLLSRMADHVGALGSQPYPAGNPFPTRGPIAMPMAMPGPGGPGGTTATAR